ncbi:hypothetical protein AVEN_136395-1 [Araneus ventricosus]|uniref:Uncharacterized protein n=1 Tax=Araneus ventricosus TaxID=182803 RepID=A0A4Y2N1X3_ARAVE|nr:hypothetical protein AVEN_136395-1 [Araneus ventricosus]
MSPQRYYFFILLSQNLCTAKPLYSGHPLFPVKTGRSKGLHSSKLQDLKDIYETEKSNFIKNAPKLSQKVLYPTSFEKQNALLALNIFHESNSAALAHEAGEKGKDTIGTKEFIDQFLKWWNIANVKNSEKGKRLKNPFCHPIRSKDREITRK